LIECDQRARDAVTNRAGLSRDAATLDLHRDIETIRDLCELERLTHDHPTGLAAEEFFDRTVVDRNLAGTLRDVDPGGGGLAAARAVETGGCHACAVLGTVVENYRLSALGCCAVCGCWLPANTCSF